MSVEIVGWNPPIALSIPNGQYNTLKEPRIGVMLHFDASGSDASALAWFRDPRCKVSYNVLALDDGSWGQVAPDDKRAWHAGVCRPSDARLTYADANSAFYGLAATTNTVFQVTAPQLLTIAWKTAQWFKKHGWNPLTESWRIVGHETEAHPRGRKLDPSGGDLKNPILSVEAVRFLVPLMRV